MADRAGNPIDDLPGPTKGSGEPRQEGHPIVWGMARDRSLRDAAAALSSGTEGAGLDLLSRIAIAIEKSFRFGQMVGQGTVGLALRCPSCEIRAGFADPEGPSGQARCLCCDHSWAHQSAAREEAIWVRSS